MIKATPTFSKNETEPIINIYSIEKTGKKLKILHLEDNSSDALVVNNQLRRSKLDYEILVVNTREKFINEVINNSPDIILADYALPSLDSYEALTILHENAIEIPFILVTATMSDEHAVDIIKKGADDYILKDRLARLPFAIENALETFRLKRANEVIVEEILSSQLHLKEALATAKVGTWETDLQTYTLKWSEDTHRIFETDSKSFQITYQKFLDFIHPDDREDLNLAIENSLTSPVDAYVEHRIISANGTIKHVIENWKIFHDEKGKPVRAVGTCRDVTEQKLAEQKLLESELFNKGVLASLSAHIAVINVDGTLIAVNKAWDDFAKENGPVHLADTSVGSNYFTVCRNAISQGDDDASQTLNGILSVFNNERTSFHLEYPCHSPHEKRWFMLTVSQFGNDETKLVIAHQNITERKIAENSLSDTSVELKKTLAELTKILDSSLDVICTINGAGKFVTVSAASQQVWGYKPEELIGREFMDFVYDEDAKITAETSESISNGVKVTAFENRYVNKNGTLVHVLWSANWDQKLELMFCIAKDITEKKRLEKAIKNERDQFYEMFFKAPSAIGMLKGADHIFEMANPLYLQLIGRTDIVGKTVADVLPEVVEQGFISLLDYVYQTGESYCDKAVLVKVATEEKDELTDFYIDFVYQAYRNDLGVIEGVFFFMNDITEQILSRKKIEKSEKFFKGVIESSDDLILILSSTGETIYASPAVSKKFGYSLNETLNLNVMDVIHPEDIPVMSAFIGKVLSHPSIPLPCPLIRERKKDGTYIWIEGTLTNYLETDGINAIVANFRDVTDRKKAEEGIRDSEEKRRLIMSGALDAIICIDVNDTITFWNPHAELIFGWKEAEVLGRKLSNLILPEALRKQHNKGMKRYLETGVGTAVNVLLELKAIRRSGEEFPIELTILPIKQGGTVFFCAFIRDITDRKVADSKLTTTLTELQAERTRLVAAQRVSKIGSWETDLHTYQVNWSAESHRIYGTDPANFIPSYSAIQELIHPEDRDKTDIAFMNSLNETGFNSIEHRIITLQGIEKCIEQNWTISRNDNGSPIVALGTCQDITDRKKAAEKVIRSEATLKVAQHVAQVGSWEIDLISTVHRWSDEYYRILGINENVKPSREIFLSCVHLDDRAMAARTIDNAFSVFKDSSFHFRFIRNDGEIGYAASQWKFEFDSNHKPIYIYGILRDITKENKAESERVKMISDIIQRNKNLEQFSYIVSHNLRSPVANIIGLTEELKEDDHDAETQMILREALSSDARRLESVIADLNTILQTKREITERKEQVVLSELARNIELSISELIQKEGVTITTNFTAANKFNTIKSYMQSIFYNLISNSIKYRQPNVNPIIDIRSHLSKGKLIILFEDNGSGIDLAKKGDQIFGLYKRFHSDTEGKGMGLYMVKTQVETLGGKISVSSEVNKGTIFTIEFDYDE